MAFVSHKNEVKTCIFVEGCLLDFFLFVASKVAMSELSLSVLALRIFLYVLPDRKAVPKEETFVLSEFGFFLNHEAIEKNSWYSDLSAFLSLDFFIWRCKLCSAETLLTWSFAHTASSSTPDTEFSRDFSRPLGSRCCLIRGFTCRGLDPTFRVTPAGFLGSFV